mmetsp:Transcript_58387/g.156078  ORF Transcript_58387/g.156078 Transcript_58387/m.156078 type:complete len:294 (+) Transcript_58387:3-884(+)
MPTIQKTIESMVSTGSQAQYFKPDQTIIIFDWDDTLCPSSWIRANKHHLSFFKPAPKTEHFQRPLRELQRECEALLTMAIKLGNVVIVTNAVHPWVETSCRNFLPSLLPLVSSLPIIYARSVYETYCCEPATQVPRGSAVDAVRAAGQRAMPGMYNAFGQNRLHGHNSRFTPRQIDMDPQRWKEVAFEQEIAGFYSRYQHQSWKNVVSIGDSIFERDAVKRVVPNRTSTKKRCRTKTLKLFDDPRMEELIAQVRVVRDVLCPMVQYDGDLDIELGEDDLNIDSALLLEKISNA